MIMEYQDMRKIKHILSIKLFIGLLLITGTVVYGFCVFSNSDKEYRAYQFQDLPFQYTINELTDSTYFQSIHSGTESWNLVTGSYFDFIYNGTTTVSSVGRDDINLVYFDGGEGGNFDPGTNVIAFSLTFTSDEGGVFHAEESDLIWNDRDFPPGMNGEPNRQDLESVIAHEFGHHMGIGHFGPYGGPPGCGETLPMATMYGFSSNGDTTGRSLHPHDKAAAVEIYADWQLHINAYDSTTGMPVEGTAISLLNGKGFYTTEPEDIEDRNLKQCAGYIVSDTQYTYTNDGGSTMLAMDTREFQVILNGFGYTPDTIAVSFQSADAIPGTEDIFLDQALIPQERYAVSVNLHDTLNNRNFTGALEFYGGSDPYPGPSAVTSDDSSGVYNIMLPPDQYEIQVLSAFPYPDFGVENIPVNADTHITLTHAAAKAVLVTDSEVGHDTEVYRDWLDSLGYSYHNWINEEHADTAPDISKYQYLDEPGIFILSVDKGEGNALGPDWISHIGDAMLETKKVFLLGSDIGSTLQGTTLLNDTLGITYLGTTPQKIIQPLVEDDPVGEGRYIVLKANADTSDMLDLATNTNVNVSHRYINTEGGAVVRHHSDKRVLLLPFELHWGYYDSNEDNLNSPEGLFANAVAWLADNTPTGNKTPDKAIPAKFRMTNNYPNPFNPSTTIAWTLPKTSRVTATVYNVRGQVVFSRDFGQMAAGKHHWIWNIDKNQEKALSSGVYWLELSALDERRIQKIMLLK